MLGLVRAIYNYSYNHVVRRRAVSHRRLGARSIETTSITSLRLTLEVNENYSVAVKKRAGASIIR